MLSFQIKDMEFTGLNTIVAIAMLALYDEYDEFDTYWQNGGYKKISDIIIFGRGLHEVSSEGKVSAQGVMGRARLFHSPSLYFSTGEYARSRVRR
jgi:hypothetical protein